MVEIGLGAIEDFEEAISWEFQTMESLQVVMLKPSSGATEVNPEGDRFVVFNKTISAGNLSLITLKDNDNNSIPVTPSINGNKLLIGSPTLEVNKSYTILVPLGSVYGYEEDIEWSFATPVVAENTIVSFLPSEYAVDTALDAVISVEFSQAVTLEIPELISVYDDDYAAVEITPSINGNILVLQHGALVIGKNYSVVIQAGSLGNYSSDIAWNFTTIQEAPPEPAELLEMYPEVDGFGIALSTEVYVTFSVPVILGNPLKIRIVDVAAGENVNISVSVDGNVLTIQHDDFEAGKAYSVEIRSGAIENYGDNIFWSFTTEEIPFQLLSTEPETDEVLERGARASFTFNKNVGAIDPSQVMTLAITEDFQFIEELTTVVYSVENIIYVSLQDTYVYPPNLIVIVINSAAFLENYHENIDLVLNTSNSNPGYFDSSFNATEMEFWADEILLEPLPSGDYYNYNGIRVLDESGTARLFRFMQSNACRIKILDGTANEVYIIEIPYNIFYAEDTRVFVYKYEPQS
jgi:hypothetical protein